VIGSAGTGGSRTLVKIRSKAVVLLEFIIKKMGILRSTDKVRVSVFLGEDLVVFGRF
jgi:hypothetical protein